MKSYKIALLPGDGIGPEVVDEAVKVLGAVERCLDRKLFELEELTASATNFLRHGVAMPEETFAHCKSADAMLMGAIGLPHARHKDGTEVNGDVIFRLRFDLDLYAGVRPVKYFPGVPSVLAQVSDIDYLIIRENVEGIYASRHGGCNVRDEVATDTIVMTRSGVQKVSGMAFRMAQSRKGRLSDGKSLVTCVDKSNVLSSYAYFRKVFDEVAADYPRIDTERIYIDAAALYQVSDPSRFDVIVTENMFGDIMSDLGSGTVGGLGMAPSGDIGDDHALFQPSHGSAPDIAGRGVANPFATILSASLMLQWLGSRSEDSDLVRASEKIDRSVGRVIMERNCLTKDLGGSSSTSEVGSAVVSQLEAFWDSERPT